jgi:NAD+ kinase
MTDTESASRAVRKVTVVVKETDYSRADVRMRALIAKSDRSMDGKLKEHQEHQATVSGVFAHFRSKGIETERLSVTALPAKFSPSDLIVTIGGDGTYLSAAARALDTPVVLIRSSDKSLGHFAAANWETFPDVLDDILSGKSKPMRLVRMSVTVQRLICEDDKTRTEETTLEHPVLNEVFVHNGGALASYVVEIGSNSELQNSSGFLVGTPAGSTAVLRSAGGKLIPVTSEVFEYVTNLPYLRPGQQRYNLLRGIVDGASEISLVSRMQHGKIDVDGKHIVIDFKIGDRVVLKRHKHDLQTWVDPDVNSQYDYFMGMYTPW